MDVKQPLSWVSWERKEIYLAWKVTETCKLNESCQRISGNAFRSIWCFWESWNIITLANFKILFNIILYVINRSNITKEFYMTFWQNMSYASYAYVFSVYEHQYQRTLAMSNRWSDSIIPRTKPHHDTIWEWKSSSHPLIWFF